MYSQISQETPRLFSKFEKTFKTVEVNVGCEVSRPMNSPQPTSRGNFTEPEKSFENPFNYTSAETKLIFQAIQECSQETREEVAEKILEKLDEVEN
jgi:hypothetical protein